MRVIVKNYVLQNRTTFENILDRVDDRVYRELAVDGEVIGLLNKKEEFYVLDSGTYPLRNSGYQFIGCLKKTAKTEFCHRLWVIFQNGEIIPPPKKDEIIEFYKDLYEFVYKPTLDWQIEPLTSGWGKVQKNIIKNFDLEKYLQVVTDHGNRTEGLHDVWINCLLYCVKLRMDINYCNSMNDKYFKPIESQQGEYREQFIFYSKKPKHTISKRTLKMYIPNTVDKNSIFPSSLNTNVVSDLHDLVGPGFLESEIQPIFRNLFVLTDCGGKCHCVYPEFSQQSGIDTINYSKVIGNPFSTGKLDMFGNIQLVDMEKFNECCDLLKLKTVNERVSLDTILKSKNEDILSLKQDLFKSTTPKDIFQKMIRNGLLRRARDTKLIPFYDEPRVNYNYVNIYKPSKMLILYSENRGTGKSSLCQFVLAIFSNDKVIELKSVKKLNNEQNGILIGKLFVFLDDLQSLKIAESESLKSHTSTHEMTIKKVYENPIQVECFFDLVVTTNYEQCIRISQQNRRNEIAHICETVEETAFWDGLHGEFCDHELLKTFIEWIKETKCINIRDRDCNFDKEYLEKIKDQCSSTKILTRIFYR